MKRYLVIPVLALCLLLSACGGKENRAESGNGEETALLLTVDGREVPLWRYLCWLEHACDQVERQYAAAGQEVDWSLETENGTLAEYVKGKALADTVLYATVENWAERYGCQVLPEEAPEETGLPLTGLSRAQEAELWAVGQMYAELFRLYCGEGRALFPAAEASSGGEALILNRILIAAGGDRESARQQAAEIFSRLNSAEDPAAVFAALAAEGDDPAGPRPAESSGWDAALLEAGRSLEIGQCSGILECGEGFSILMRVEPDEAEWREAEFDALLQAAAEAAAVTAEPHYHALRPEEVSGQAEGD